MFLNKNQNSSHPVTLAKADSESKSSEGQESVL